VTRWIGSEPACEIHEAFGLGYFPIPKEATFIDGKTVHGPWAIMCQNCYWGHGAGIGVGRGQQYEWDGEHWVKIPTKT
jgi:hypothetical protein